MISRWWLFGEGMENVPFAPCLFLVFLIKQGILFSLSPSSILPYFVGRLSFHLMDREDRKGMGEVEWKCQGSPSFNVLATFGDNLNFGLIFGISGWSPCQEV